MKDVITVKNMRESDADTIKHSIPSKELMYRAAMGVYRAVDWKGRIGILTGAGNNGGDGYALACILADQEVNCCIYCISEKFSEDGRYYHDLAASKGVEIKMFTQGDTLHNYDILVDCMLGTGFSGNVRGLFRPAIKAINNSRSYVVSVDINSGMNGDTGQAELAVKADLTVTIGFLKTGLFLGDAIWYVGKLAIAEIGIGLVKQEYFLAAPKELSFPQSGLCPTENSVEVLTPGEAASLTKRGHSIPLTAEEYARKNHCLVQVLGKNSLLTDGFRTYFIEAGDFPIEILSLGDR